MSACHLLPDPRFWAKVHKPIGDAGCWEWTGATYRGGYGHLQRTVAGVARSLSSHRYAYECIVGPIPNRYVLDHLCRNHACCNPEHLEPVTVLVNTKRGEAGGFREGMIKGVNGKFIGRLAG